MFTNRLYYVYIMTNKNNTVLYIGVTNSLCRRNIEHKNSNNSFTSRYNIDKLIHYEIFQNSGEAISREKNLKNWKREWKNKLVEKHNPGWRDLFDEIEVDFEV